MNFLICPLSEEEVEAFDTPFDFQNNGVLYNFKVEYFEDEAVVLKDNVGRILPMDITHLPDIIATLSRIYNYQFSKDAAITSLKENLIKGFTG
jgi:hypothetical protein